MDLTVPDLSDFRRMWNAGRTPFWTGLPVARFVVRFARGFPGTLVTLRIARFEFRWVTDFWTRLPFARLVIRVFAWRFPITLVAYRLRRRTFFGTRSVIARWCARW